MINGIECHFQVQENHCIYITAIYIESPAVSRLYKYSDSRVQGAKTWLLVSDNLLISQKTIQLIIHYSLEHFSYYWYNSDWPIIIHISSFTLFK